MAKAAAKTNAASASVERRPALAGRALSAPGVKVEILPPAERISLRAPEASLAALSKGLGVTLPTKPKSSATKGGRTALWLGPDEWLIIDESGNDPLADCAKVSALHSAVGISHRNVAISVNGPAAAVTVNSGCPQDLSLEAFPVEAASRTILGKSEIVLLRTAADAFRVECWRSFSDYVFTFLSEAASDAAN
ncbi:sarcosine oxidase subunit gamma family protein [Mesorhizobium sp. M1C.F.Ca.ET.193.01.1.1]|uniref:sarcosine oxidase subunit gamma n=1 Tax=unclassified Mesorhizobium TaxID=325217 RepID=UPI000FD19D2F|nr:MULTISPECIES: sarcosine oxidase subunit gamma [unclassified Mesorhizobium]TGS94506.1 sarcosine oxidase subunit gamma family protein [bacterium M00.F.Ca.ET.177.01.1.1]TGQ51208.1 sarcosine oxidase subunit gamma family protein [Mesorhizobium sp. M1C.F.Ca.ET.210.01.1.1]TGQ66996.1 sarcosine oxidase subunit gamma family protein [Mesorhizobium sp. M1C.F.Ca.ET.212.01.1.1]TGR01119.1 sarcosine oxidase subunit gamma family protein [Mesorhizobium sp. M1C.F.Ca.ET.204.01.1.1]TGR21798.1 sarcosine oxidase 